MLRKTLVLISRPFGCLLYLKNGGGGNHWLTVYANERASKDDRRNKATRANSSVFSRYQLTRAAAVAGSIVPYWQTALYWKGDVRGRIGGKVTPATARWS